MDGLVGLMLVSRGRRDLVVPPVVHGVGVLGALFVHFFLIRVWGQQYGMTSTRVLVEVYAYTSLGLSTVIASSSIALWMWYRKLLSSETDD